MVAMFQSARENIRHLFNLDFAENGGLIFMPKGGDEVAELPPARFPAHSCISEFTCGLVGQSRVDGS